MNIFYTVTIACGLFGAAMPVTIYLIRFIRHRNRLRKDTTDAS